MPKVTDLPIHVLRDDQCIQFSTPVNVTKEGVFTTTLPSDAVSKISEYGLELCRNRLGNIGYFEAKSLDELKKDIYKICEEALSRELIEDKLVIKYEIITSCTYCKDKDGELVPNGYWLKDKDPGQLIDNWVHGTANLFGNMPHIPSISVFAQIFHKKTYQYQSGKTLTVLEPYRPKNNLKDKSPIDWIASLCNTAPSRIANGYHACSEKERKKYLESLPEVDATEHNAQFFVAMHQMIFKMNELFAGFANPSVLMEYLENNKTPQIKI